MQFWQQSCKSYYSFYRYISVLKHLFNVLQSFCAFYKHFSHLKLNQSYITYRRTFKSIKNHSYKNVMENQQ